MYQELINLIITRRKYLEDSGYIEEQKHLQKVEQLKPIQ